MAVTVDVKDLTGRFVRFEFGRADSLLGLDSIEEKLRGLAGSGLTRLCPSVRTIVIDSITMLPLTIGTIILLKDGGIGFAGYVGEGDSTLRVVGLLKGEMSWIRPK